ncbi:class F sortase [Actinomycetospora sp. NBRC 106375]|uniref:class F sortase n=1 Tax=Actinomycetospora sp. NBRC 106375 TaxID=3032207 RepID=UPI0024A39264|nr:class F sortase [Actinomycetospora sp. NBRC 106375]GLZ46188.1 class F sortase [Actinomycetospora sp. NBRC 106375]
MAAPEAPPETPSRREGVLDKATGRITALVLAVLAVGVLVAFLNSGDEPEGPRSTSLPPAERVSVPTPLPAAPITGVDAPTIGLSTGDTTSLGLRDDNSLDVPSNAATVGWYERSASPGEVGPAVLAAHVDFRGEQGAFARLGQLRPGDTVEVHRADDTTAVFAVESVDRFAKDAFPTDAVYGPTPDSQLRMITCGGVFDERTHSYQDNVVVRAHLTGAYRPI